MKNSYWFISFGIRQIFSQPYPKYNVLHYTSPPCVAMTIIQKHIKTIFRIVKTFTELYDLNNMTLHIKIHEYSFEPNKCSKILMNKMDTAINRHNVVVQKLHMGEFNCITRQTIRILRYTLMFL